MPINKETHVSATTILTKEIHKKVKELAKKNKRSLSGQIAYMVESYIESHEGSDKE